MLQMWHVCCHELVVGWTTIQSFVPDGGSRWENSERIKKTTNAEPHYPRNKDTVSKVVMSGGHTNMRAHIQTHSHTQPGTYMQKRPQNTDFLYYTHPILHKDAHAYRHTCIHTHTHTSAWIVVKELVCVHSELFNLRPQSFCFHSVVIWVCRRGDKYRLNTVQSGRTEKYLLLNV